MLILQSGGPCGARSLRALRSSDTPAPRSSAAPVRARSRLFALAHRVLAKTDHALADSFEARGIRVDGRDARGERFHAEPFVDPRGEVASAARLPRHRVEHVEIESAGIDA